MMKRNLKNELPDQSDMLDACDKLRQRALTLRPGAPLPEAANSEDLFVQHDALVAHCASLERGGVAATAATAATPQKPAKPTEAQLWAALPGLQSTAKRWENIISKETSRFVTRPAACDSPDVATATTALEAHVLDCKEKWSAAMKLRPPAEKIAAGIRAGVRAFDRDGNPAALRVVVTEAARSMSVAERCAHAKATGEMLFAPAIRQDSVTAKCLKAKGVDPLTWKP